MSARLSVAEQRARQITEADLQAAVIKAAHVHGWKVAHFRAARTKHGWVTPVAADGAGWPDLVLVRPPRALFVELKKELAKPSDDQAAWLDLLRGAGLHAVVWRPSHWLSGHIDEVLR